MESSHEFSPQSINGHRLIELSSVTSTNKFLEMLLDKGSGEQGLIVISKDQSEGRGMSGNLWISEKSKNLLMSMLHYTEGLTTQNQFYLSKCCAIAVSKAIDQTIGAEQSRIKWPNDVYINSLKTAGILIQSSIKAEKIQYSFLGIGININQSEFSLDNATSIKLETGQKFEIMEVLSHLTKELDHSLKALADFDFDFINKTYYNKLIGYQQWLKYKKEEVEFEGLIQKIEDDGHLLMKLKNGKQQHFAVKEISLIPAGTSGQPTY
jgi:BirA family biotin operon repressor/biotin-[acetyl-CoA-carboxylase] ligase